MPKKQICGHCEYYDMGWGGCMNPSTKLFEMETDGIFDYPACEEFELEGSYKKKENHGRL